MQTYKSYGKLYYRKGSWVTLFCCNDLMRYYQKQIKEKPQLLQYPKFGSHITVCNGKWENPTDNWKAYHKKKVWFTYTNQIIEDSRFYYLQVESSFLLKVRDSLGLLPIDKHPILKRGLHLTLARKLNR